MNITAIGRIFLFIPILLLSQFIIAQSLNNKITMGIEAQPLQKALEAVGELSGFRMSYNLKEVARYNNVTISKEIRTVQTTLNLLLANTDLTFVIKGRNVVITWRKDVFVFNEKETVPSVTLRGNVTDRSGKPLQGISVRVKGANRGAITDEKGFYMLTTPADTTLLFSYTGIRTIEEPVMNRRVIDVVMIDEAQDLNQVVVTGYVSKKASELTGSVIQLSGKELLSGVPAVSDIYELLKGKVPGLLNQTIRGTSTIPSYGVGPTTPLIVLDGTILGNVDINTIINPEDIETISVLKDAASTSIYGSRAALGVIVLTTKRGKQGLTFNLSSRTGIETYPHKLKMMNTSQLIDHMDKYTAGIWDATDSYQTLYPEKGDFINDVRIYTDGDRSKNYDWSKALKPNTTFNDINLSFSSGNNQARIYGSVGWYKQTGPYIHSNTDRKTAKINTDFNLSSKLSASFSGSVVVNSSNTQNGNMDPISYLPWIGPRDATGKWNTALTMPLGNLTSLMDTYNVPNVLYEADKYDNTSKSQTQTYLGSFTVKYQPFSFLTLKSTNSINHVAGNYNSYYDPRSESGKLGIYSSSFILAYYYSSVDAKGTLDLSNSGSDVYMTSNTLAFNKGFGKHTVSLFAGQEYSRTKSSSNSISYYNILPGERNAGAATSIGDFNTFGFGLPYTPVGSQTDNGMFSLFGEASYRFDQRFTLTGSLRTDASPAFGKENRYGTFYSLSGAWQVDQEVFMANVKNVLNTLKLRYAYGTSGRDLGGYYLNKTYFSNTRSYNGVSQSGSVISQLANNGIKWETTYNHSLGVDFSFISRISGSIDLYHKRTAGMVLPVTLPATQGSYTQQTNIGEILNKGIELSLKADIIRQRNFTWAVSGNVTYNKNRINSLAPGVRTFNMQPGDAINDIKKVPYEGVNPDNGAPRFRLGDGSVVEGLTSAIVADTLNRVKIGNTTPKFYGGCQSSWTYKNFRLSADLYFELGQLVNNYQYYSYTDPSTAYYSGQNSVIFPKAWRIWSGKGDTRANMPNIYDANYGSGMFYSTTNSVWYQNGSFLRLRNIRLSYDLPKNIVSKIQLKNVNVYANVDNVFVIKKKALWEDTESVYNPLRFVFGLNVSF
jgi:TonB-linked SusC/RagA family outer membrane protein